MTIDTLIIALMWLLSIGLFLYVLTLMEKSRTEELTALMHERAQWRLERADLLSRIQAGSYAEYKTQEIRMIRATVKEEKPGPIEPM